MPSRVNPARRFVSFPPGVSRRSPVPSGRTSQTCSFIPPPGAELTASHDPSGDQETAPTGSSSGVASAGKPPSDGTVHACGCPERFETNARREPSGESRYRRLPILVSSPIFSGKVFPEELKVKTRAGSARP